MEVSVNVGALHQAGLHHAHYTPLLHTYRAACMGTH
jgi:hypothetical protein